MIDALVEAIGPDGTLVMPCLSLSGASTMAETLDRDLVFDLKRTPSTVGAITEAFRRRSGTCRSMHPTHSVCASGARAEWITSGPDTAPTNFGPGTPWYKIMKEGGSIVGLGIDFGPVTFVHVIEDTIDDFPLNVYRAKVYEAKVIDEKTRKATMKVKAHDPKIS